MVMNAIGILPVLALIALPGLRQTTAVETLAETQGRHGVPPPRIGVASAPLLTILPIGDGGSRDLHPEEFDFPVERELTLMADDISGRPHHPTLKVSDGVIHGVLWCNMVGMSIKSLSQTEFSAPSLTSTLIDCGTEIIAADDLITGILAACRWHKEGSELVFENEHGRLRFAIGPAP